MPETMRHPTRPYQFVHGTSAVHALPAGWKLLAATVLGGLALAVPSHAGLLVIALVLVAGYGWAGLGLVVLWKDLRWLLLQGAFIVVLTVAVAGRDAFESGVRTAAQLTLLFLPAALMLRTTSVTSLLEPLKRRLPDRLAFAAGATLRFVPSFARECGELVEMQRLRGARLHARDLWHPVAWSDWLHCVVFPMTVRSIEVAQQAAEAAEMRGVGRVEPTGPRARCNEGGSP